MQLVREEHLVNAVECQLASIDPSGIIDELLYDHFSGFTCYVIGGVPRDGLIGEITGREQDSTDVDVLVDDSRKVVDLPDIFPDADFNRFGAARLTIDETTIEIGTFSSHRRGRRGRNQNLQSTLRRADLTTSAIAYRLRDGRLYDNGAIDSIRRGVVDIQQLERPYHVPIARAVVHALRFQFNLGLTVIEGISTHYDHLFGEQMERYIELIGRSDMAQDAMKMIEAVKKRTTTYVAMQY